MGWWMDKIHTGLDVVGMIPAVGNVADLANAGLYAVQGDVVNAGISLAGCIPGAGQAATGARLAAKAGKEVLEQAAKKGTKEAAEKATKEALGKAAKEKAEKEAKEKAAKKAAEKDVGTKVTKSPEEGDKVYRVWGDDAGPNGRSWTRTDPRTVDGYRDAAGLPDGNSGRFVSEGTLVDPVGVEVRDALPLHGNKGGLDEIVVPNPQSQIKLDGVSGVNPEF